MGAQGLGTAGRIRYETKVAERSSRQPITVEASAELSHAKAKKTVMSF